MDAISDETFFSSRVRMAEERSQPEFSPAFLDLGHLGPDPAADCQAAGLDSGGYFLSSRIHLALLNLRSCDVINRLCDVTLGSCCKIIRKYLT